MKAKKKRIFDIIQIGKKDDFPSRAFDIFIVWVIIINIAVLFLETFDELNGYAPLFKIVEMITIVIFLCGIPSAYLDGGIFISGQGVL